MPLVTFYEDCNLTFQQGCVIATTITNAAMQPRTATSTALDPNLWSDLSAWYVWLTTGVP